MKKKTIYFQNRPLTRGEAAALLDKLTREGLEQKFPAVTPELTNRLARERAYITGDSELLQRFVLFQDLFQYAGDRHCFIRTSPELLESLTAYCLGLTPVDPIRMEIPVESFLTDRYPQLWIPQDGAQELAAYLADACPGVDPDSVMKVDDITTGYDCMLREIEAATGTRLDLYSLDFSDPDIYAALGDIYSPEMLSSSIQREIHPQTLEEQMAALNFSMLVNSKYEYTILNPLLNQYLAASEAPAGNSGSAPLQISRGCRIYDDQRIAHFAEESGCSLEWLMRVARKSKSKESLKTRDHLAYMIFYACRRLGIPPRVTAPILMRISSMMIYFFCGFLAFRTAEILFDVIEIYWLTYLYINYYKDCLETASAN